MPIKNKYTYNPLAGQFDQITDLSDLNDTDIEVTANGINKPLKDAIEDGDIGGSLESYNASIVHGKTVPLYDWAPTPSIETTDIFPVAGGYRHSAWSPDGEWLALACLNAPYLRILRFNPIEQTFTSISYGDFPSTIPNKVAWSPDGKYLAVGGSTYNPGIEIYRRYGNEFRITPLISVSIGTGSVSSTTFSPNGKYLVVISAGIFNIYTVSDTTFTKLTNPASTPIYSLQACWSPDSKYLVITSADLTPNVVIYRVVNGTFTKLPDPSPLPSSMPIACNWSPDGNVLALGTSDPYVTLYNFNKTTEVFSQQTITTDDPGYEANVVSWSPDGNYLGVGHNQAPHLHVYKKEGNVYTQISTVSSTNAIESVSWHPTQQYMVITPQVFGSSTIRLFKSSAPMPDIVGKTPEVKSLIGNPISPMLQFASFLPGSFLRQQWFSSSSSYTPSVWVKRIIVVVVGGGGNGGASVNTSPISHGCGGGGGGYALKMLYAHQLVTPVTITVGGAGGTSSFGAFCSATGGSAGAAGALTNTRGGVAGFGTAGDVLYPGTQGQAGQCGTYFHVTSGSGGSSFLCPGGALSVKGTSAGTAQTGNAGYSNTGGGGSGGAEGASTRGAGGAGGSGVVIVYEYGDI